MAIAILADSVLPPVSPIVEPLINSLVAKSFSKLSDGPVVIGILHRVGEASLVIWDVMMLHIGGEVPVAGEALENLASGRGLHLHGSFQQFPGIKIPDAHLVCADT